jgi:hypothetical protein
MKLLPPSLESLQEFDPRCDEPLGFEPRSGGELYDGDFTMRENGIWIESHPFAVRLHKTTHGLSVTIYENGAEDGNPLASAYAENPKKA